MAGDPMLPTGHECQIRIRQPGGIFSDEAFPERVVFPQRLPKSASIPGAERIRAGNEGDAGNQLPLDIDVMQQWQPDPVETGVFLH